MGMAKVIKVGGGEYESFGHVPYFSQGFATTPSLITSSSVLKKSHTPMAMSLLVA